MGRCISNASFLVVSLLTGFDSEDGQVLLFLNVVFYTVFFVVPFNDLTRYGT